VHIRSAALGLAFANGGARPLAVTDYSSPAAAKGPFDLVYWGQYSMIWSQKNHLILDRDTKYMARVRRLIARRP
jgi:hypothetical protein